MLRLRTRLGKAADALNRIRGSRDRLGLRDPPRALRRVHRNGRCPGLTVSARTDIVRRAHDALNRGDAEGLAALCAADFRLDMSDRVFNPEVYSGHDGIRRFMTEVHEVWETFTWEPTELTETDDLVLALVHSVGHGRGSGLKIDRHSAMLWRIPGETLLAMTFYRDPSAARRAAEINSG
jgi:ketosteroid isomerase-like protein